MALRFYVDVGVNNVFQLCRLKKGKARECTRISESNC